MMKRSDGTGMRVGVGVGDVIGRNFLQEGCIGFTLQFVQDSVG